MSPWSRALSLAAQTPPSRNRYVDFLRASSIGAVIAGHWLIAAPWIRDGELQLDHMLAVQPWTQWLTLLFQVMPLFFLVGGYSNAASWEAARRTGKPYGTWFAGRARRLIGPVVPLVLGLLWSLSQTASLSFEQGAWRQAAALHVLPATDTPDFAATLRDQGAQKGTGAREVRINVAWPERVNDPMLPILRWQLRDFPNARFSGALPAEPAPLVITPVADNARLSQGYRGREFALLQRWAPSGLGDFNAHLRWVLFRAAKTPPEKLNVLLWVEQK